jgi:hypothetical protein
MVLSHGAERARDYPFATVGARAADAVTSTGGRGTTSRRHPSAARGSRGSVRADSVEVVLAKPIERAARAVSSRDASLAYRIEWTIRADMEVRGVAVEAERVAVARHQAPPFPIELVLTAVAVLALV